LVVVMTRGAGKKGGALIDESDGQKKKKGLDKKYY